MQTSKAFLFDLNGTMIHDMNSIKAGYTILQIKKNF